MVVEERGEEVPFHVQCPREDLQQSCGQALHVAIVLTDACRESRRHGWQDVRLERGRSERLPVIRGNRHIEAAEGELLLDVGQRRAVEGAPEVLLPDPDVTTADAVSRVRETLLFRCRQVEERLCGRGEGRDALCVDAVPHDGEEADLLQGLVDLTVDASRRGFVTREKAGDIDFGYGHDLP